MTEHWYVFYGLEYGKSKNFTIRFVCNKALTLNKENLLKKKNQLLCWKKCVMWYNISDWRSKGNGIRHRLDHSIPSFPDVKAIGNLRHLTFCSWAWGLDSPRNIWTTLFSNITESLLIYQTFYHSAWFAMMFSIWRIVTFMQNLWWKIDWVARKKLVNETWINAYYKPLLAQCTYLCIFRYAT